MVKRDDVKKAFSDRLSTACSEAGVSGRGLAAKIRNELTRQGIRVSEAGIWKWMNAAAIPDNSKIQALSSWLKIRPEWLEYGRGNMREIGVSERDVDAISVKQKPESYLVEVFDVAASAGAGVTVFDEFVQTIRAIEYSSDEARLIFGNRPQEHIKMIGVNGDSMSGTFEPRDQIFVDVGIDYFDGDGIYIFTLDGKLYIKRLQLQHTRLAVISDNKKYETWYITNFEEAKLTVHGKVLVSQSRSYKFHG